MFWRRKRDQGFEWHKYVRTTIKLRRDARRDRAEQLKQQVKQQAADGARAAGAAAAVAAHASATGLGAMTGIVLAAAVALPGQLLAILRKVIRLSGSGLGVAANWLSVVLRPLLILLAKPKVGIIIASIGAFLMAIGMLRAVIQGRADNDAILTLAAGAVALLAAFSPRLLMGEGLDLPIKVAGYRFDVRWIGGLAFAILAGAGAWYAGGALRNSALSPSNPFVSTRTIEGRATVLAADLLRVGADTVRLASIEAPDREQFCSRPGNKRWRCGDAATAALQRLTSGRTLKCTVGAAAADGAAMGVCLDGTIDIGQAMVKGGHVFAVTGLLSRYTSSETEAKTAKAGIWAGGDADRPSVWRAKLWDEAKRRAPDGCPIKGAITGGNKVYVLPWATDYERTRVNTTRGGRWFCSIEDAVTAGWKAPTRS